jgi:hypothetical protein
MLCQVLLIIQATQKKNSDQIGGHIQIPGQYFMHPHGDTTSTEHESDLHDPRTGTASSSDHVTVPMATDPAADQQPQSLEPEAPTTPVGSSTPQADAAPPVPPTSSPQRDPDLARASSVVGLSMPLPAATPAAPAARQPHLDPARTTSSTGVDSTSAPATATEIPSSGSSAPSDPTAAPAPQHPSTRLQ